MDIEFDPAKDGANIAKHGVSLAAASGLELDKAVMAADTRFDYGEDRFIAIGRSRAPFTSSYSPTADPAFERSAFARPAKRR